MKIRFSVPSGEILVIPRVSLWVDVPHIERWCVNYKQLHLPVLHSNFLREANAEGHHFERTKSLANYSLA